MTAERRVRPITGKLGAATKHLQRARASIESARTKQADNAVKTAINQLGAVLNALDNGAGPKVPAPMEQVTENYVELVIEQLVDARDAPLESAQ